VTPEELVLIEASAAQVVAHPTAFAERFYETLFSVAPRTRALFGDDMSAQKDKLVSEVAFLIGASADIDTFVGRAHDLGRRHSDYGVTADDFAPVREALLAALETVGGDNVTDEHLAAWDKLYRLIAATMLEGMREQTFADR